MITYNIPLLLAPIPLLSLSKNAPLLIFTLINQSNPPRILSPFPPLTLAINRSVDPAARHGVHKRDTDSGAPDDAAGGEPIQEGARIPPPQRQKHVL